MKFDIIYKDALKNVKLKGDVQINELINLSPEVPEAGAIPPEKAEALAAPVAHVDLPPEEAQATDIVSGEDKVEKIIDNDKVLVLKVLSKEASIKYGKNTKWDISSTTDNGNYFNKYVNEHGYTMYFVIVKNTQDAEKYVVAVAPTGKLEVYDAADKPVDYDLFNEKLVSWGIPKLSDF